jgi:hypothetical protein
MMWGFFPTAPVFKVFFFVFVLQPGDFVPFRTFPPRAVANCRPRNQVKLVTVRLALRPGGASIVQTGVFVTGQFSAVCPKCQCLFDV